MTNFSNLLKSRKTRLQALNLSGINLSETGSVKLSVGIAENSTLDKLFLSIFYI